MLFNLPHDTPPYHLKQLTIHYAFNSLFAFGRLNLQGTASGGIDYNGMAG